MGLSRWPCRQALCDCTHQCFGLPPDASPGGYVAILPLMYTATSSNTSRHLASAFQGQPGPARENFLTLSVTDGLWQHPGGRQDGCGDWNNLSLQTSPWGISQSFCWASRLHKAPVFSLSLVSTSVETDQKSYNRDLKYIFQALTI